MKKNKQLSYRLLSIALSIFLILSLVACGSGTEAETEDVDPTADFAEFRWPRSAVAQVLPTPQSTFGKIVWEDASGFYIEIGNTSSGDFADYIDECWERGFTLNYNKGSDFFWADHQDGYHVDLRHDGNNIMTIWAMTRDNEPEPEDEPELEQAPDTPDENQLDENEDEPVVSDVEWREFLRLYEEWIDSYIELLEKYNEDPTDLTILNDYLEMMIELAEWAEMAEQIEVDLANDPNALREYLETLSRIILRLSEVEF